MKPLYYFNDLYYVYCIVCTTVSVSDSKHFPPVSCCFELYEMFGKNFFWLMLMCTIETAERMLLLLTQGKVPFFSVSFSLFP